MEPTSKALVLVVDDDADIRECLLDLLGSEGYQPLGARDGQDALEQLGRLRRPCLVVLDMMMPRMDGHEFLARVRASPELNANLRIVVCSASTTLPSECPPVAAILPKPFEVDALLQLLEPRRYA
jgi:two-component system chemotaxis response regulator CheY